MLESIKRSLRGWLGHVTLSAVISFAPAKISAETGHPVSQGLEHSGGCKGASVATEAKKRAGPILGQVPFMTAYGERDPKH